MHTYETLEILYDKLLEDEDKILLLQKKREIKLHRLEKKKETKRRKQSGLDELSNESQSDKAESLEDVSDVDDESSEILDESLSEQDFELKGLKESYKIERQAIGDVRDFLNESTADFNKAIKQINLQLQIEGHLDQNGLVLSLEKERLIIMNSHQKQNELNSSAEKPKEEQNDLSRNEINIPKEEKISSKPTASILAINRSPDVQRQSKIGQLSVQKKLPSFKLDLSKCKQEQASVLDKANHASDFSDLIGSDIIQQETLNQSIQSPSKVINDVQKSPQRIKLQVNNAPIVVKKQIQPQTQFQTQIKQQKQIIIPRLALQDIQRQTSECSSITKPDLNALKAKAETPSILQKQQLKSLKVISSKRDSTQEFTIADETKEILMEQEQEMKELKKNFEIQKKLIFQIKQLLGNEAMNDPEIIKNITQLKNKSFLEEERFQMQMEDLSSQIIRLTEAFKFQLFQNQNQQTQKENQIASEVKHETQPQIGGKAAQIFKSSLKVNYQSLQGDQKIDLSQLDLKLKALKAGGGMTLRVRNICSNESLTEFQRSFGTSTTLFEAKTGRLPVVANYLRNTDLSLLQGLKNNENLRLKTAQRSSQIETQNFSRINEKSVIEDSNYQNSTELENDPVVSQLMQKKFYPKTDISPASDGQSDLELSQDQTEDFERAISPLLTYEKTDTLKKRRVNNMPIRGPNLKDNSGSKQAYFDKAKPILNAQDYRSNIPADKKKSYSILSNYQMEIDAFVGDVCLTNTGRDEQLKKNGENSDGANKKIGVYLEKMRERNSSLQERLNLSFKSSSRLDSSSIAQRPATSFQNVKWLNFIDRKKCKSLNRGSALSNRQQAKNPNNLNLSLIKKQPASNDKGENIEAVVQAKKTKIQLTQRTNPSFINISQMRPQTIVIPEKTKDQIIQLHQINCPNIELDGLQAEKANRQDINLSNFFTSGDDRFIEINKNNSAQITRVEHNQITSQLANIGTLCSKTPLQNFDQCTQVLQQLSKTSRPTSIVNKTNENRNKSSELKSPNSYSSFIKAKASNEENQIVQKQSYEKITGIFQRGQIFNSQILDQKSLFATHSKSPLNKDFQQDDDAKIQNESQFSHNQIQSKTYSTQRVGSVQPIPQQSDRKLNSSKKQKSKPSNMQQTQKQKKQGALTVRNNKNVANSFSFQRKSSLVEENGQK